jgi:hypothetical protein
MTMKKIILVGIITATTILTSCSSFKDKGLNDYYSYYNKNVNKVKVPPILLNVLAGKKELKPILKYIQTAELITITNVNAKMDKNLTSAITFDQFQKYMNFNLAGELITLYGIENNDVISNLIFKIQNGNEIKLVDAKVNLPIEEFNKILVNL